VRNNHNITVLQIHALYSGLIMTMEIYCIANITARMIHEATVQR